MRLYTRGDFSARPEHDTPEIARADLAGVALELAAAGVKELGAFAWLEPPPEAAARAAQDLLVRLGAIDDDRNLTETGRRMLRFPVHPRLGRMIVEGERRGIAADAYAIAALVGEREIATGSRRNDGRRARCSSDVLAMLEDFEAAAELGPEAVRAMGLEPARVAAVARVQKQLERIGRTRRAVAAPPPGELERAALSTILAGFPDRVGRLRRPATATGRRGREIVLAAGGTAVLADSSAVDDVDLVVAVDAEERTEGRSSRTLVRVASAIEADWLLELFTGLLRDTTEVVWNEGAGRVDVVRRLAYEGLVLDETRGHDGDPAAIGRVLAHAALARGWRRLDQSEDVERWLSRVAFAREHCPELGLPSFGEPEIEAAFAALCAGKRSLAELDDADLGRSLRARLSAAQARGLAEVAPEVIVLGGGRRARVDYPASAPPFVASRLQDFFGMDEVRKVAAGRVPVVLHLLAPNRRAVQVTTDLAGFWRQHYPAIARELRRRYPKHAWPDDPRSAAPPGPRR